MKKNYWLSYFLYSIIFFCYIIFSNKWLLLLNEQRINTFEILPYLVWSTIIFIIFGALLGIEKFILERRKEGHWEVNLPKVILLGIPSLYLAFGYYLYYCPIRFVQLTLTYPIQFLLQGNSSFWPIFQMLFGYIVVTSFHKVEY